MEVHWLISNSDQLIGKEGLIGKKACDLYKPGNPNNADFTVSSLLFQTIKEGCKVKGFC
jgi:hypothetical protein